MHWHEFLVVFLFLVGQCLGGGGQLCYPGAYVVSNGTCALCPAGTYSMQAGATGCFACMLGSYADREGMSQCVLSGMGEFVPRAGQSACMLCRPGSFQYVGGSSSCASCEQGSYQSAYGSTLCQSCVSGSYQAVAGGAACLACVSGSYSSSAGSTVCNRCSVGSFQRSVYATACTPCQAGFMQPVPGMGECLPCQSGTFQSSEGATACTLCYNGTFQKSSGATLCEACPTGKHLAHPGGSSPLDCIDCDSGSYTPALGSSACMACSMGSFVALEGQTACHMCLPGTYQPVTGQSGCVLCKAGTYNDRIGASDDGACARCKSGTFSTTLGAPSADVCLQCPPGHFSADPGADSRLSCLPCPEGTVSALDSTHCPACGDGMYCTGGSASPVLCQDENLACNGTHLLASPGFLPVLLEENCTGVIPCPLGTVCHLKDPARAGILSLYGNETQDRVHFVVFAPGSNQTRLNCPGSVMSYGYSRVGRGALINDGILFRLQALDCPVGSFLLEDTCAPCPAGSYLGTVGAFSITSCAPCPPGAFSASPGSSSCLACTPGTYQPGVWGTNCIACEPGTYQPLQHASECHPCTPGSFLASNGGSSCHLCAAGEAQSQAGSMGCSACGSSEFSSPGDTACTGCGMTPSLQEDFCQPPGLYPPVLNSFFMSVRGERETDMCLGMGVSRYLPGVPARLNLPVHPLFHQDVRCVHTLGVMGIPGLSQVWTTTQRLVRRASSLRVVPHGPAINLALCGREGLDIAFVMQDEHGNYDTDLTGAEATLAFVAPEGMDLLFWTQCEQLPRKVSDASEMMVGSCRTRDFCPTMDVIARVTVSWAGGVSVRGEHVLKVEKALMCPPQTTWGGLVELEAPGMRFFPGDLVRSSVRILNLPSALASFRFQFLLRKGFEFVSFTSDMYTSSSLGDDRTLTVEGDSTGSASSCLGTLIFRVGGTDSGVLPALRVLPDVFSVTLNDGSVHILQIKTQGYTCRGDGALFVLVYHHSVYALVARLSAPALVDWEAVQSAATQSRVMVEALGVWNSQGRFSVVTDDIKCAPEAKGVVVVHSCSFIRVVPGRKGGWVKIRVQTRSASTAVKLPVFVPWNATVVAIPGLDRLSGRFKVLARLRLGVARDYLGAELDVTPYLGKFHAQGVTVQGEEWACPPGLESETPFTVGVPVLFQGLCPKALASQAVDREIWPFLFTGGRSGVGAFTFNPPVLHPATPSGVLLFLSTDEGLVVPAPPVISPGERVVVGDQQNWTLVALGMSPGCIQIQGKSWIPVLPASPASLHVTLSTYSLVTQHDIWDLMPTSATLAEAWLILSDGTTLDVRQDPRLFWKSTDDLDIVGGEGVRSRAKSGNFTVDFGVLGIPCLHTTVIVQVYPYSTQSATIACNSCPSTLTSRDDPLSWQFPKKFPSSIQESAFTVQYILVNGSTVERPCKIVVRGAGVLENSILYGTAQGVVEVTTDSARGKVEIPVRERWILSYTLLCNLYPCTDRETRLTIPGDGASFAPFAYSTSLLVTLKLVLDGGVAAQSELLDGMHLEVNGARSASASVPLLAAGELNVSLGLQDNYRLDQTSVTVRVETLQSLVVSGPPVLFQIHCSRVWEQGRFSVMAQLTDGSSAALLPADTLVPDGRVLLAGSGPGIFGAERSGEGWVRVSFGNLSAVYAVQATQTSKYYTGIKVQQLPLVWTVRSDEDVPLIVSLEPEYSVYRPDDIPPRVLRWSSSVPGVIQFGNDSSHARLVSDYHGRLTISCVLLACMQADFMIVQQEIRVNLVPSHSGQIDLGNAIGQALMPANVGEVVMIPVFLFAETRLRAYSITIILDHVSLAPLDCFAGELFQSWCYLDNATDLYTVGANFSSSRRSGRILVAQVRGRVALNTVTQIYVLLHQAVVGEGQALGPVAYRFSVRVGNDDRGVDRFTQPYLNRVGPLKPLPLVIPPFPGDDEPSFLRVCCDLVVAQDSARLSKHFPSRFFISGIYLDPGNVSLFAVDPRVQLLFDQSLLEFQPESGAFSLLPAGVWTPARTRISVVYTHPETLGILSAHLEITLAEVDQLRLVPELLELRRVHCAQTVFRNGTLHAELVLTQNLGVIPLDPDNILAVDLGDPSIIRLLDTRSDGGVMVQGLGPGYSSVTVKIHRLQVTSRVLVLQESERFESYSLPDPLRITACQGSSVQIPVTGRLYDGTILSHLASLFSVVVNVAGPVQAQAGNLSLLILGNTAPDDSTLAHVSLHMPECQGSPQVTVQAMLRTRLVACIDPFHQVADVELAGSSQGGIVLRLVGRRVSAFYVHIRTDALDCRVLLATWDCSTGPNSTIIMVGILPEPSDEVAIAILEPVVGSLWGFVEVFSGISPYRMSIVAGRVGAMPCVDPVKALMPILPVVDTAVLSRADDARFTLELMTDRQRLVDPSVYSHSGELSLMFKVTDRFLEPDSDRTQILVGLLSPVLPLLPGASRLPDGGQSVQALPVSDGWYAVQWQGNVPAMTLDVEYRVTTSTSNRAQVWTLHNLSLGQPFRECPRYATQHASFLSTYRIFLRHPNFDWIATRLVCAAHVPHRRIRFSGFNSSGAGWGEISLALESFIRVHQVYDVIMSPWFETLVRMVPPNPSSSIIGRRSSWRQRALDVPSTPVLAESLLAYVNDTQDTPAPCPPGMYFSRNGTYMHLPMHSVAGEDCYGMSCVQGYRMLPDQTCAPVDVPLDVVWICVIVIVSFVVLIVCLLCCVKMARVSHAKDSALSKDPQPPLPVIMRRDEMTMGHDPYDDVFPEHEWGSQVQLDDYSSTMLDDHSIHSPLPFGNFRR